MASISLDETEFRAFINRVIAWYKDRGGFPSCVILCDEMEGLIENAFFHGKLTDLVSHNTDHRGKIRMHLGGVRVRFTNKIDMYRSLWLLGKNKVEHAGPGAA